MKQITTIPFNKPHLTTKELGYIQEAHERGMLSGDGIFTKRCHAWLEKNLSAKKALLTHSCTAALEMMAFLTILRPGDEVIMPSFTFVSTANAFVLRGAVPVFVDIRPDTQNINELLIENAISKKTRAIMVVHYAGVSCEMDTILRIAKKHNLIVLEDAAQGFRAKYKEKYLGTLGDLGAFSFHETKNIISGEGGALLINKSKYIEKAEIIREKGTNRSKFFRGQVDKYTWVGLGSSYLPGEVIAAFLMAQFEKSEDITRKRINFWNIYHDALRGLEDRGFLQRPFIPKECTHNGHMYYILLRNLETRGRLIEKLKKEGIMSVFHYIPLHSSSAGKKFSRYVGSMKVTNNTSNTLLRLPLYYDLTEKDIHRVIDIVKNFFL